jgi:peptidoglycan/xylan/chitin deacetylase (PgdA/CDA1 family)
LAALALLTVLASPGLARAQAATAISPGTECYRIPTREKVVALTFDDAWIDSDLESILAALKGAGIKATFFPTGVGVESSPELARRIAAEGHEFGSHSYTHSKLQNMSGEEVLTQTQKTEEAFSCAGLKDPVPLFRAPWGEVDRGVLSVLGDEGYVNIMWTARGGDTVAHRTSAQVVVNIMKSVRPGAIIVMHTRNEVTPKALPELIRRIKAKGYRFVTLSETLLSPEQRLSRYQQTSPLLAYLGKWSQQASALQSGGSLSRADSAGAKVVASFTGTTFELLALTGPECGKASVAIDGGTPQEVDLYSATEQHRVSVFLTSSLVDTTHVALISYTGAKNVASTGYSINVDAVRVAGTLTQVAASLAAASAAPTRTRGWSILKFWMPGGSPKAF